MRKLRLAVWLNLDNNPENGGGYQYNKKLIQAISKFQFRHAKVIFITNSTNILDTKIENIEIVNVCFKSKSFYKKYLRIFIKKIFQGSKLGNYLSEKDKLEKNKINSQLSYHCDVIYYLTPRVEFPDFPYIYTLWDIAHMTSFAFPEFTFNQKFESRKRHHDYFPHKALMVFCESQTGKNDAIRYLNLNPEKIKVLPIFPSNIIDNEVISIKPAILKYEDLFIHYPAQFWPHKNHYNLLNAFKIVLSEFSNLKLILSGSDKGNFSYIKNIIKSLNLENNVINLGFITQEELKWVYLNSKGLVMPSLLGPTNMPPLEALALNCPVAVSDINGNREILGDSAIYFNPLDYMQIAKSISQLINRPPKISLDFKMYRPNMNLLDIYFKELSNIRLLWD